MAPGGRFSAAFCEAADGDVSAKVIPATATGIDRRSTPARDCFRRFEFRLCDMNRHLIGGVVQVAARIPYGGRGLSSSLRVGSAGENRVVATLRFPLV